MQTQPAPSDLTLYSEVACNYSQRTRIALALKGTPVELVELDLLRRPEAFMATPSRGSVPALEWDGSTMGLVDLTYAPIFARFGGLEQFHGWSLPADLEGYRANYRRIAARG